MGDNNIPNPNQPNPLEDPGDFYIDLKNLGSNLGSFDFEPFLDCLGNDLKDGQEPSQAIISDLGRDSGVSCTTMEALKKCVSLKGKAGDTNENPKQEAPQLSLEEQQKVNARKERNKQSAKNSRERKEKKMNKLKKEVNDKTKENEALEEEIVKLKKYTTICRKALPLFSSTHGMKDDTVANINSLQEYNKGQVDLTSFTHLGLNDYNVLNTCNGSSFQLNTSLPLIDESQIYLPVQQLPDTGINGELVTSLSSHINKCQSKANQIANIESFLMNGNNGWASSIGDDFFAGTDTPVEQSRSQVIVSNNDYDVNPSEYREEERNYDMDIPPTQGDIDFGKSVPFGQTKDSDDTRMMTLMDISQPATAQVIAHDTSSGQEKSRTNHQSQAYFNHPGPPWNGETSTSCQDSGLSGNSAYKDEWTQPNIKAGYKFETSVWHAGNGMESVEKEEQEEYNSLVNSL